MIIPSLRLISFEVHAKTRVIALIMIRKAMSIIFSRANPTGLIAAATPTKKDIEDIRADDITKCHIDFVLSGGNDGGDKLRKTGSHGNDRKSNQCLAKSQTGCN